jgi:phosphatidylinositol glycan class M
MDRAVKFASIWLLNPMVAQISTRGSSEGLLGVMVSALLWSVLAGRIRLGGFLLGFAVHFKIYPFIYAASIIWWLDDERSSSKDLSKTAPPKSMFDQILSFINPARVTLVVYSLVTFVLINGAMYYA